MKIKIISRANGNWYNIGEIYDVRDADKYSVIGVQVWNSHEDNKHPDVVMHGDYEYI